MSLRAASSSLQLARSPSDKKKSALRKKGKHPPPAPPVVLVPEKSSLEENDSPESDDEIFDLDAESNNVKSESVALDFDDVVYRSDNSVADSNVEPTFTMDDDVVYTRNRSDADGAPSNGKDDEAIDYDDVVIVKDDVPNPTIPVVRFPTLFDTSKELNPSCATDLIIFLLQAFIPATSPVSIASTPPHSLASSSSPGSSLKRSADDYLLAKWKSTVLSPVTLQIPYRIILYYL